MLRIGHGARTRTLTGPREKRGADGANPDPFETKLPPLKPVPDEFMAPSPPFSRQYWALQERVDPKIKEREKAYLREVDEGRQPFNSSLGSRPYLLPRRKPQIPPRDQTPALPDAKLPLTEKTYVHEIVPYQNRRRDPPYARFNQLLDQLQKTAAEPTWLVRWEPMQMKNAVVLLSNKQRVQKKVVSGLSFHMRGVGGAWDGLAVDAEVDPKGTKYHFAAEAMLEPNPSSPNARNPTHRLAPTITFRWIRRAGVPLRCFIYVDLVWWTTDASRPPPPVTAWFGPVPMDGGDGPEIIEYITKSDLLEGHAGVERKFPGTSAHDYVTVVPPGVIEIK